MSEFLKILNCKKKKKNHRNKYTVSHLYKIQKHTKINITFRDTNIHCETITTSKTDKTESNNY